MDLFIVGEIAYTFATVFSLAFEKTHIPKIRLSSLEGMQGHIGPSAQTNHENRF